jgi:penicillin-binding protein 1B
VNRRKGLVILLAVAATVGLGGLIGVGGWIWRIDRTWSPLVEPRIREAQNLASVRVLARNESGLEQWVGSFTAGRTEERQALKLADVPPLLIHSIVTLEDPRFLEHGGFDPLGILRATVKNLIKLRYTQGGSTLTQQLVKNVFLTPEKTIRRKVTELVLAALVEQRFTKDEILEAYLNEVYMGQIGSLEIHGVGRAAEYYFGRKLDTLPVHELALIAAMIAGPGYYSPFTHPDRTRARRDKVLHNLADAKLIMPEELEVALKQDLPKTTTYASKTRSAYLMDALREDLLATRNEVEFLKGGFDVHLALDLELQRKAEEVLLARSKQWPAGMQGLIVAADPRTCEIRAYAGGTDYRVSQLDRIRQSQRPIGSLMKPLELIRLMNEDPALSLATTLEDRPLDWSFDNGRQKWTPANFDLKFRGKTTLRHTLEQSINVPVVRLFFERRPDGQLMDLLEPVRALGLEIPPQRALPSALLGAIDQTPRRTLLAYLRATRMALGMAQDAGDFACRLSFEQQPVPALPAGVPPLGPPPAVPPPAPVGVTTAATPAPGAPAPAPTPAPPAPTAAGFSQAGARLVIAALEGAIRRGTGAAFGAKLPPGQAWASKTGTSSDKRDSWYALLSPQLVVIAWVGRDDNKVTPFTGATGALPVVAELMAESRYVKGAPDWNWPPVPGLRWRPVNLTTTCLPPDEKIEAIRASFPEPTSATPPPAPFEVEGHPYVWELFREGAEPARCAP